MVLILIVAVVRLCVGVYYDVGDVGAVVVCCDYVDYGIGVGDVVVTVGVGIVDICGVCVGSVAVVEGYEVVVVDGCVDDTERCHWKCWHCR